MFVKKIKRVKKNLGNGHNHVTPYSKSLLIQKQKNMNEDVTTSFLRNLLSNVGDCSSQEQIITISFELLNKLLNASKLE